MHVNNNNKHIYPDIKTKIYDRYDENLITVSIINNNTMN